MDEFLTTGPVAGTHLDGGVGAVGAEGFRGPAGMRCVEEW